MSTLRTLWRSPWVRYGISVVLVVIVVRLAHLDHLTLPTRRADLVLAAVLTVPFVLIKTVRWLILLRYAGLQATFGEALGSYIAGLAAALVTPGRVGEVTRAAYLSDPRKVRIGALVLVDRLYDVLVLALLGSVGGYALLAPWMGVSLGVLGVVGAYLITFPGQLSPLIALFSAVGPLRKRLEKVSDGLRGLSAPTALVCLGLTAASFAIVLAQYWIILSAWEAHAQFSIAVLVFPLVILTNVLPITVGGLGVREGTAQYLLTHHFAISGSVAVASAFLMFFLNTAAPGIIGAFLAPLLRAGSPALSPSPASSHANPQGQAGV